MRSREGTLLAQTCELVVEAQIAYGEGDERARGASPSRPTRGSTRTRPTSTARSACPASASSAGSRTIASSRPYASMLARVDPAARRARQHRAGSRRWGCSGRTACSRPSTCARSARRDGRPFAVVRSYMAHHQGMLLVALDNLLNDQIMVERFHADRAGRDRRAAAQRARARDRAAPSGRSPSTRRRAHRRRERPRRVRRRSVVARTRSGRPQAFVLEQRSPLEPRDRLRRRRPALAGARAHALPARRRRATTTACGSTCATRRAVACGSRPRSEARTTFAVHKAEFHRRERGHLGARRRRRRARRRRRGAAGHAAQRDGSTPAPRGDERGGARAPRRPSRPRAHPAFVEHVRRERVRRPSSTRSSSRAARSRRRRSRAVLVHRLVTRGRRGDLRGLRDRPRAPSSGAARSARAPAVARAAAEDRCAVASGAVLDPDHEPDGQRRAEAEARR